MTLSVFLLLHRFKMFIKLYFSHLKSNNRQHLQQYYLNSQPFALWSKQIGYWAPTFQLHLSFINDSTILLLTTITYSWGKYLPFIKLFIVHNNYLTLITIFTINNNHLPLIKLFTVNNSYLPLKKIFTVNKTIYR